MNNMYSYIQTFISYHRELKRENKTRQNNNSSIQTIV